MNPQQQFPSPILKGIDALPPLHGYTITTAKPRSKTILDVPEAEEEEPILATWRVGLGKGAAFTSDLSPNWGRDWVNWEQYRAFVHQLITDVARVNQAEQPADAGLTPRAVRAMVIVEDYAPEASFMNITAEVEGPRETVQRLVLEQVGPRRYEARFPLEGEKGGIRSPRSERDRERRRAASDGRAPLRARLRRADGPVLAGVPPPPRRSIDARTASPNETDGRVLTGDEEGRDIFVEERQPTQRSLPVFDWFLIALACLIPLDVAMRRVQTRLAGRRQLVRGRQQAQGF